MLFEMQTRLAQQWVDLATSGLRSMTDAMAGASQAGPEGASPSASSANRGARTERRSWDPLMIDASAVWPWPGFTGAAGWPARSSSAWGWPGAASATAGWPMQGWPVAGWPTLAPGAGSASMGWPWMWPMVGMPGPAPSSFPPRPIDVMLWPLAFWQHAMSVPMAAPWARTGGWYGAWSWPGAAADMSAAARQMAHAAEISGAVASVYRSASGFAAAVLAPMGVEPPRAEPALPWPLALWQPFLPPRR